MLQIPGDGVVALFVGVVLALPLGEGVGGGGDGREPELAGDVPQGGAEMYQLVACLLHRTADAGADLDLRAQKLGTHLAAQRLLAFGEQGGRRLGREIAAFFVDEEIFLLDADAECWFRNGHGGLWHTLKSHGRVYARSDESFEKVTDQIGDARGKHADGNGLQPRPPPRRRRPITSERADGEEG